jgi:16S rRNA (guanine527-N7)-methyltransferase
MNLAAELAVGIAALGLQLAPETGEKLLGYLALLKRWNSTYNLTAVRETKDMLTHHLLDSLAIIPHLRGVSWLDVGSGAGLPGLPVAIANRDASVVLLDSSHKKTSFLQQAVIELGLRNVSVACARVEEWEPRRQFDVVVSRALADLREFVALAGRHCMRGGVIAAMKGVYPHEELTQVPPDYRLQNVLELEVPGLNARRHLVLIEPA